MEPFITRQLDKPVTVFLTNGVKLIGKITNYDHNALFLEREGSLQLVMLHSIATILPTQQEIN
jgi:host factor-I protein